MVRALRVDKVALAGLEAVLRLYRDPAWALRAVPCLRMISMEEAEEDPRRPVEERLEDLLKQMTLEEKAGMMFETMIGMNKDGTIMEKMGMFPLPLTSEMIAKRLMNHFNILEGTDPRHMAEWSNRIQKLAEQTRLGIPVTISTDPRHAFSNNPLASLTSGSFSQFPEPTGLAATRDADLIQQFGDISSKC